MYAPPMADAPGPNPWFFDLWSHFYDAPLVQRVTYRPPQDAVLRELRAAGSQRVLDMGCGTGLLTARVRKELAPKRLLGCDFSRGMLHEAAHRDPELAWVRADAQRLPLPDAGFDAVISTEAFHWFPDPDRALREFFRVLVPNGRLMLAFVNPRAAWLSHVTQTTSRVFGEPARWPTRARLRGQIEAAGFRIESQRHVLRLPAPLLLPCVLTVASRPV